VRELRICSGKNKKYSNYYADFFQKLEKLKDKDAQLTEKLKGKDEQLAGKVNDKDAIIRDKEVVITEISNQNNWLRGEYAKLNDRLNALLLPAPKRSIWDKILRRNAAKVD